MAKNNSSLTETKEEKLFYARLDDLARYADNGSVAESDFMSPSEQYKAEKYFLVKGSKGRICCFGGYFAAQRKQVLLLPEYLTEHIGYSSAEEMIADGYSSISALRIEGSGYRTLSHRDYLGALLSLGIKRSMLGDICVFGDCEAVVFCRREIEDFILSTLSEVGSDKVRVSKTKIDVNMPSCERFESLCDTVASNRIDCVVASLCNLSREKAQTLVVGGLVEHNYSQDTAPDSRVSQGDVISARGYGKFIVRDIGDRTKRGRIRLLADKYV